MRPADKVSSSRLIVRSEQKSTVPEDWSWEAQGDDRNSQRVTNESECIVWVLCGCGCGCVSERMAEARTT